MKIVIIASSSDASLQLNENQSMKEKFRNVNMMQVPCCGLPFCALIRVQCSEMFMITNGCSETVTDGTVVGLAITLFTHISVDLTFAGGFDVDGVVFVAELLVEASPILLSLSTSMFSFVAVTGILKLSFVASLLILCSQKINRFKKKIALPRTRLNECYCTADISLASAFIYSSLQNRRQIILENDSTVKRLSTLRLVDIKKCPTIQWKCKQWPHFIRNTISLWSLLILYNIFYYIERTCS